MRPTCPTVLLERHAGTTASRSFDRPLVRLGVTAGVSVTWIGAYVLATAKALQLF